MCLCVGAAKEFFDKFSLDHEWYYQEDLLQLSTVTKAEHMAGNQLLDNFKCVNHMYHLFCSTENTCKCLSGSQSRMFKTNSDWSSHRFARRSLFLC